MWLWAAVLDSAALKHCSLVHRHLLGIHHVQSRKGRELCQESIINGDWCTYQFPPEENPKLAPLSFVCFCFILFHSIPFYLWGGKNSTDMVTFHILEAFDNAPKGEKAWIFSLIKYHPL